jgi:CRP-like cAMP-binding protein
MTPKPAADPNAPSLNPLARKLAIYDTLTDREIARLAEAIGGYRDVDAGEDIVGVDQRTVFSTVILEGWAARYKLLPNGRRQITALHIPGDFVDLHSFLLHVMDQGVTALSRCNVAQVPHEALRKITDSEPHLTRLLWMSTLTDGALHREWLAAMGQMPTAAQAAHLVCELYLRLDAVDLVSNAGFAFPMTQVELADTLGVSTVHLNRTVQELRAMKLITWSGGRLTVLDFPRLAKLGQFDPTYLHQRREPR